MSTAWLSEGEDENRVLELDAPGFPQAQHSAEADLFCRQSAMPAHDQGALESAHVVVVGCGGLGSWIALGLARMGICRLTLIDPDRFDRTNAPRQLMFGADIGTFKAHALARNVIPHMTNPGIVRAIATQVEEVLDEHASDASVMVVGVDSNAARLHVSAWARRRACSAVFAMLSVDGMRAQVFLQKPTGPSLTDVLPDLDPRARQPCAAAAVSSCFIAAGHAIALVISTLGSGSLPAWRETSLNGHTERSVAMGEIVSSNSET